MRRLLVALSLMGGLLSPAFAADYDLPILRGSQPVAPIAPVTTVGPGDFHALERHLLRRRGQLQQLDCRLCKYHGAAHTLQSALNDPGADGAAVIDRGARQRL